MVSHIDHYDVYRVRSHLPQLLSCKIQHIIVNRIYENQELVYSIPYTAVENPPLNVLNTQLGVFAMHRKMQRHVVLCCSQYLLTRSNRKGATLVTCLSYATTSCLCLRQQLV